MSWSSPDLRVQVREGPPRGGMLVSLVYLEEPANPCVAPDPDQVAGVDFLTPVSSGTSYEFVGSAPLFLLLERWVDQIYANSLRSFFALFPVTHLLPSFQNR